MAKQVVDRETGEVLEEPDFVKVYIKDLCKIKNLKTGQTNIFRFMLSNMNWENVVSYGPTSKKKFLQEHGIKNQTFNNYVSDLIRAGLIQRVGRGEFMVNPKYAVKVDWAKAQSIRWTSEYTMEGKREVVEVVQGDDVLVRSSSYDPFDDDFAEPTPPPPKPKGKAKAKKPATKPSHSPEELEIFEYWKERMGKSNASIFNEKRVKAVKARMKEGYTIEQIKRAVDGCAASDWHMGKNPQGKRYDDLARICSEGSRVEEFEQIAIDYESGAMANRKQNVNEEIRRGTYQLDSEERMRTVDDDFEKFFGYRPGEHQGKRDSSNDLSGNIFDMSNV